MCWGTGGFLSSGVLRGSLSLPGDMAWKLPFGLQWIWPVPLLVAAYFAPESEYDNVDSISQMKMSLQGGSDTVV